MAWGHFNRPTPDYHSAQRAAATRFYGSRTRSQIRALDPYTAAGQAAGHRWFTHTKWQNRRDAIVAKHQRERHLRRLAEHRARVAAKRKMLSRLEGGSSGFPFNVQSPLVLALLAAGDSVRNANANIGRKVSLTSQLRSLQSTADALWGVAGKSYGGGKRPGVAIGTSPGAAGQVWLGNKHTTRLSANLAYAAGSANPQARAQLAKVLLHEWAHTRQPNRNWGDKRRTEGGAELYSRMLMHRLGISDPNKVYAPYVHWLKRHDPKRRYTTRGQFE